ncbi:MAG TPA: glycosyltransferase [Polyangiales bacterium]
MSTLTTILLAATAIGAVFYLLAIGSAFVHIQRRKRRTAPAQFPPVSLLKPIKGLEENLELCLRSFFEQEYPGPIEIVFASAYRDDPGMRVARAVARDYPMVRARFVMTDENWGLNPKVSNLQGALKAAAHDLVLQTDANVWAPPDYLRNVVSELLAEQASLLSSLVSGVGERSVGAAMENLQLTGYVAPGCCAALKLANIPCVIGKSMLLRKSELRALGGLELVKDSLAEDFLLGRHFVSQGKKVLLSATPILNMNVDTPVERFFARHARWLKMRAVLHAPGFLCDLLANPIALGVLALLSAQLDPTVAPYVGALVVLKCLLEWFTVRAIRGVPLKLSHAALVPLKDVLLFSIWVYAIFSRSVVWRGIRFRMGSDSQLLPDEGALPVRVLRRLLSA